MGLFVFFVLVLIVRSESVESDGSHTVSESCDSAMCVCQPHITINPPVCAPSPPVNSGICCNSSAIQELVSMKQKVTTRQLEELQNAVSGNQETVSSELEDARRKMDELQVTVSVNQENVTTEVMGIRQQIEELQASVSAILDTSGFPEDCSEILARGVSISGTYTVQPLDSGAVFQVYCDMETDGGGWTVFQRRKDGSVDFYLDFANYSRGFGNLEGEFWLGNDNLHRLTAQGEYELRVELSDFENETRYAVYDSFSIADVNDNYRLSLGSYSGTAGDSMYYHNNQQFSAKDRDNDASSTSCAQRFYSAWWFNSCFTCNLNGAYLRGNTTEFAKGVDWYHWKGHNYSLKTSEMKIRPTPQ